MDRDRRERERWIGESEIRTDTLNRRERECEQRILRWNTQSGEGGRNGAMNSGIEWTHREFGKMGGLGFGGAWAAAHGLSPGLYTRDGWAMRRACGSNWEGGKFEPVWAGPVGIGMRGWV